MYIIRRVHDNLCDLCNTIILVFNVHKDTGLGFIKLTEVSLTQT